MCVANVGFNFIKILKYCWWWGSFIAHC